MKDPPGKRPSGERPAGNRPSGETSAGKRQAGERPASVKIFIRVYGINFLVFQPSRRRDSQAEALNSPCKSNNIN